MTIISTYNYDSFRAYGGASQGDPYLIQTQELSPSNVANRNGYGDSIDISADSNYIIVGCALSNNVNIGGAAFIWQKNANTYIEQTILSNGANQGFFGINVAINFDGTYAFIGQSGNSSANATPFTRTGNVFIYSRTGNSWTYETKLTQTDYVDGQLGLSVATNYYGNYIASYAYNPTLNESKVYIWSGSGNSWTLQQTINSNSVTANYGGFGEQLQFDKDANILIISAPTATNSSQFGQVYVYKRSNTTWNYDQTLSASQSINSQNFGRDMSLSFDGNTLLVVAPEFSGNYTGNIYTFKNSNAGFTQTQIFTPTPVSIDYNPGAITNNNDRCAVGYLYDNPNGAVATFTLTNNSSEYTQTQWFQSNNIANGDNFGSRVAIDESGNTLIVSATGADRANVSNFGTVYVFVNENI